LRNQLSDVLGHDSRLSQAKEADRMIRRGREVYVLIEGIVELDEDVHPERDGYVNVRTHHGFRVALPIECVAEWEVDVPLGPAPLCVIL
jgi:hypothetical protein